MKRLKSILNGTNAEVFKTLLLYYKPPPATIIDVTCGHKHFWTLLNPMINTATLDGRGSYKVVFSDIRPIGDIQADYRKILDLYPELEGRFDVVVYDPPYTEVSIVVNGYKRWNPSERYATNQFEGDTALTEDHIRAFIKQAYRLLKSDGIVIAKLQDTVNWWHFTFYNNIKPFKLEALYIQNLGQNWAEHVEVRGVKKPIPIHAYWFILTK